MLWSMYRSTNGLNKAEGNLPHLFSSPFYQIYISERLSALICQHFFFRSVNKPKILCLKMNVMEAQVTGLNLTILFLSCRSVMHEVIQYLDSTSINNLLICYAGKNGKPSTKPHGKMVGYEQNETIIKILQSYFYLKQYMLQVDRSFYYSIYQSNRFLRIQNQHFCLLTETGNHFDQLYQHRLNLKSFINSTLNQIQSQSIIETLERLADDPEVPMGKLMRENVGAGCNSTFQQFLVTFNPDQQSSLSQQAEQLNSLFQSRIQNFYVQQFLTFTSPKKQTQQMKIRILRFAPHEITYENYQHYTLPDNQLHNFIIALFLLAQEQITASSKYIETIEDPYHKFLELMLRYSLFRNFVISVQEQFGFVFKTYSELYSDIYGDSKMFPELTFWRSALANWFIKMSQFHRQCDEVFGMYLLEVRDKNSIEFLKKSEAKNPEIFGKVLDQYRLNHFTVQEKTEIYDLVADELEVLAKEYIDYIMDLSIDEISVYQCGSSKQKLTMPYHMFEQQLITLNQNYIADKLQKIGSKEILSEIIRDDLKFLFENQHVKAITLLKILNQQQQMCGNNFTVDGFGVQAAIQDFDGKLDYFNSKNQAIFNVEDPYLRAFYQIVSEISVKDILSKTVDTANTSELSQEPSLMYDSEDQDQILDMVIEAQGSQQEQELVDDPPLSNLYYQHGLFNYDNQTSEMVDQSQQLQQIYHQIGYTEL